VRKNQPKASADDDIDNIDDGIYNVADEVNWNNDDDYDDTSFVDDN